MILSFFWFEARMSLPFARSSFRDTLLSARNVRSTGDTDGIAVAKRPMTAVERARAGREQGLQLPGNERR
jgi:hypothetical protein